MAWFYVPVSCPLTLRQDRVPVNTLEHEGETRYVVNTCENSPCSAPECAQCVNAVWRELKDRERSECTE